MCLPFGATQCQVRYNSAVASCWQCSPRRPRRASCLLLRLPRSLQLSSPLSLCYLMFVRECSRVLHTLLRRCSFPWRESACTALARCFGGLVLRSRECVVWCRMLTHARVVVCHVLTSPTLLRSRRVRFLRCDGGCEVLCVIFVGGIQYRLV